MRRIEWWHFQWPSVTPNAGFKVTVFFEKVNISKRVARFVSDSWVSWYVSLKDDTDTSVSLACQGTSDKAIVFGPCPSTDCSLVGGPGVAFVCLYGSRRSVKVLSFSFHFKGLECPWEESGPLKSVSACGKFSKSLIIRFCYYNLICCRVK